MNKSDQKQSWIISRSFDLSWFISPGLIAVVLVLAADFFGFPNNISHGSSRTSGNALPPWLWLLLIPGVDVSHVYSTIFRAYLDKEVWNRKKVLLALTPVLCFVGALVLYSFGKLFFWGVMAYLAVFHFIRQQYGFLSLYARAEKGRERFSFIWDKIFLYLITGLPVLYWHVAPEGRQFEWFMEGDFYQFPNRIIASLTHLTFWICILIYSCIQAYLVLKKETISTGKLLLLFNTACVWYVGIVLLNDDFAFTLTNVINHGIPYMALVFAYADFRKDQLPSSLYYSFKRGALAILPFVLLLLAFAFSEEWLWDSFVWREHPNLFGNVSVIKAELGIGLEGILVPIFFLPQFTHYILDGFLWKGGKENSELVGFLGLRDSNS
ncbi:hypothetical protein [Leptospira sarikeiensis]|uniref:Uncharacterized protein n=1 Tax=Leptospira sarikeiensis TaxID=2484943 RepID=A0A4R9K8K4_9LEPT|nr:hypothetical protein [Leptospira sarikeiensis]TGL61025.1 hypothetical protein EHQ64_14630 [Leptospira sarikeiensis]